MFSWPGSNEFGDGKPSDTNLIRLQTLYHADKQKTDLYILELVTWLHRLFNLVRHRDDNMIKPLAVYQNPISKKRLSFHSDVLTSSESAMEAKRTELSKEDREMLNQACRRKSVPGISKSQEIPRDNRSKQNRVYAFSRSMGSSPNRDFSMRRISLYPEINVLDVMDGLDLSTV